MHDDKVTTPTISTILLVPADDVLARFWSKVDKSGSCWVWTAGASHNGYGRFKWLGKTHRAHRLSFAWAAGRHPSDLVLHRCDNPACVKPSHLYDGSQKENMRDRSVRGRTDQRGVRNPSARLRPDDVRAIRADQRSQSRIAADYDIGQSHVSQIKRRKIWRHL